MGRLAGVAPILIALLASVATPSAAQPAPGPAPQGTAAGDVSALSVLRSTLALTTLQIQQLRWDQTGDPCGNASCEIGACAWNGIACRDGRVTGIDISPAVVNATPALLSGRLPSRLANLSRLQTLNASLQSLTGTLPAAWGALRDLRTLDVSNNDISGTLPSEWRNMDSIRTMNLSSNNLTGGLPLLWGMLYTLQTLNATRTRICRPYTSGIIPLLLDRNATDCAPGLFGSSPGAAEALGLGPAAPPPPPPPSLSSPVLQMSTGVNVAVSVVIGAFLLFGIGAGAFRVRRQQAAHTAWLRARADAMQRQEREDEEAFQQYLKRMAPPLLTLSPDRHELTLAVPCIADAQAGGGPDPRGGGGGSPGGGGGGFAPTADGPDAAQYLPPRGASPGAIEAGTSRPGSAGAPDADWLRFRPPPRARKLPLFVIDAHIASDGGLTFDPAEAAELSGPRPVAHTAVDMPEEPAERGSRSAGLRGTLSNSKRGGGGGREAAPLEVEGARRGSPSQPHSTAASRAPSAAALGPQPQDPSVAARVRERIEQLQEARPAAAAAADAGPAPPPPFLSWAPLRAALRLETVEARATRLRAQAAEAGRAEVRAERGQSATSGRPSTSGRP